MSVLTSHNTVEWYTPPVYIDLVKNVLGKIDLDPASAKFCQKWIKANCWFGKKENGLKQDWKANTVFCNPPYGKEDGKSGQATWSKKMIEEWYKGNFKEGILLVNSTQGYKWYEQLWESFPVCCARERIKFVDINGKVGGQAKRGQTFVYFGINILKFKQVFSKIGKVIIPETISIEKVI